MADRKSLNALDIRELQERLREFAAARDWEQFHTPKNLAMALAAEAGELLEIFQWLTSDESAALGNKERARVAGEVADIQIYLARLADILDLSIPDAVDAKLVENAQKYPVEQSKGNATKYSRREEA